MTLSLGTLLSTLTPLAGTIPGVALFLSHLGPGGAIANALTSTEVMFQRANAIPFLNDSAWTRGLANWNLIGQWNAEDAIRSLALIGPPQKKIECFNAREFSDGEGQIDITTGSGLMTVVRSLESASPASEPAGNVGIPRPPGGLRFLIHFIRTFGGELSSFRFA